MTTSKNIGTFISSDCNSEATPHRSWKGKVIKFLFVGLFLSLSISVSVSLLYSYVLHFGCISTSFFSFNGLATYA